MKRYIIIFLAYIVAVLLCACFYRNYDMDASTTTPTIYEADTQQPNLSAPIDSPDIEIDENGWTVIRVLDIQDFLRICDVRSTIELEKIPVLSKEYYRLSDQSGMIESLNFKNQVCLYNEGFLCINDECEKIVFCNFVELCSNIDIMHDTLEAIGVQAEPSKIIAVTAFGYPLVLYVECDHSAWLVTIDDEHDIVKRDGDHLDNYAVRAYTLDEFKNKFNGVSRGRFS